MRILSADDIRQAVPMAAAIDAVADAFARLSAGKAVVPLRTPIELPEHDAISLFMPASLPADDRATAALGLKVVSVFPHNQQHYSLPAITALVVLIDPQNGRPLAALEGSYLTALRTGAGSGAATRLMAREDARVLALFGAGAQARSHALAMCAVRPIEQILIVNRSRERAEQLIQQLRNNGITATITVAADAAAALTSADLVCCTTPSTTPLFDDDHVRPGTHLNLIGSYKPTMIEAPITTVARAYTIVDQRAAAWAEAGELIQGRDAGLFGDDHVAGELGELVAGKLPGRSSAGQVTIFKSVGNAIQDLAVGRLALTRAIELGLGSEVAL